MEFSFFQLLPLPLNFKGKLVTVVPSAVASAECSSGVPFNISFFSLTGKGGNTKWKLQC